VKGTVVLVHFRKAGAKKDRPWTVHVKGECIPAKSVTFGVECQTVFKPEKKSNPRAWIRCVGFVRTYADGHVGIFPYDRA
jgi:hypothetical protein